MPIRPHGDSAALTEIAELAAAVCASRERQAETLDQGAAFIAAAVAWNPVVLTGLAREVAGIAYPVAVGALAGAAGIPEEAVTAGYVQAIAANFISAAVRLVPLGQSAGLRVLAGLEPAIMTVVDDKPRRRPGLDRRLLLSVRYCRNASRDPVHEAVPHMTRSPNGPLRVGVGGPVGTGKTALMDALCKRLRDRFEIAAITNDIYTKEDAEFLTPRGVADARPHPRHRDRRLPAYRDPGGCEHQPGGGGRAQPAFPRPRRDPDRERRR